MCHISQTRGIGTIRSHQHGPEYEDDGLSSDEADGQEGEASDDENENEIELKSSTPDESNVFTPQAHSSSPDLTPTPSPTAASRPPIQQGRYFSSIPKILTRRPVRRTTPSDTSSSPQSQSTSSSRQSSLPTATPKRKKIPGPWHGQTSAGFELEADNDVMGIVMLEIHSATDLPRLRNSKSFESLTHRALNQI
jgi:phosphatidylserine decarboxylase